MNRSSPDLRTCEGRRGARPPTAGKTPFLSSLPYGPSGPMLDPGTRLQRFTLLKHLGSGRGAEVYLARDEQRSHEVALKIADLRPEVATHITARMQQEIDVRHRVGSHPHILALFDTHRIRVGGLDLLVLSMEYADGGDLRHWLGRGTHEPPERLASGVMHVLSAARGLTELHRAGVAHLDFKPENIFRVRGVWKLGDFDHAWEVSESSEGAPRDSVSSDDPRGRGTPDYLSPEAAGTGPGVIDQRADIYSLGLVLRETMGSAAGRMTRTAPKKHVKGAARTVAGVVRRCLKPAPDDRFQLAEHAIEAMRAVLRDHAEAGANPNSDSNPNSNWENQDRRWRQARRCLTDGPTRDAKRLCQNLIDHHPHHPGARAVLKDLALQERHTVAISRQLMSGDTMISLNEGLGLARELVDLVPDHECAAQLIDALEQQIFECRHRLAEALRRVSSGRPSGFQAALDEASARDPGNPVAMDAGVCARDLVDRLQKLPERIDEAIAHRRYGRALKSVRKHRRLLARVTKRTRNLLGAIEGNGESFEEGSV